MRAPQSTRLTVSLLGSLLATSLLFSALPQTAQAQTSPEAIRSYNDGIEAYNHGDVPGALRRFDRAVQIDPNYAAAYYNMGSIYYQLKQYGDAADMFQKAVNLSPTDSQAKYNLALSLEKLSHNQEAVRVLQQIPVNDPKYPQAKAKIDDLSPPLKTASQNKPAASTAKPAQKPSTPLVQPAKPAANKLSAQAFSKGYDGPTGIAIGPGGYMYVANYSKNQIYRVGAGGEKSVFAQGEGIKGPIGLAFNPKTNELYVANYLLNSVSRINASGKVSTLVSSLNKPYNLFMDTVNNVLYVSEQDPANQISKIALPK